MNIEQGFVIIAGKRVDLPNNLTVINESVINKAVQTVGDEPYYMESSVEVVRIPSTVVCIDSFAFRDNTDLTKVEVPLLNSLKFIGKSAFEGCSNLESFDFGVCDKLRMIDNDAFLGTKIGESKFKALPSGICKLVNEGESVRFEISGGSERTTLAKATVVYEQV